MRHQQLWQWWKVWLALHRGNIHKFESNKKQRKFSHSFSSRSTKCRNWMLVQFEHQPTFGHSNIRYNNLADKWKNGKLEPTEVTKDPGECQCKERVCFESMFTYDLSKNPWEKVVRFKLNLNSWSYIIFGNGLKNYLHPGPCSAFSEQYWMGEMDRTHTFLIMVMENLMW